MLDVKEKILKNHFLKYTVSGYMAEITKIQPKNKLKNIKVNEFLCRGIYFPVTPSYILKSALSPITLMQLKTISSKTYVSNNVSQII